MSSANAIAIAAPASRLSRQSHVVWGSRVVTVGGGAPVRVQSMTNTDTVDVIGTAIQVKELALAGSEMVRITVNTPEAAEAVPHIRDQLDKMGIDVPLIGDFHYNGHRLLTDHPACAEALSKYRINPGNVGKGDKHDRQFSQMVEAAVPDFLAHGLGEQFCFSDAFVPTPRAPGAPHRGSPPRCRRACSRRAQASRATGARTS